ncbi:alpha/beta-hydrolase [Phellopilus nigrolimitatus]|nr:alpha/beta-hydrolase [Phellopilus nigrolimitatus]
MTMDSSLYKNIKTSRDLNYHVYVRKPQSNKPSLLFVHGFPSTSYDWHKQVHYFEELGYGVVVVDLLGFGGTDKPLNPELYRMKALAGDMVDILNAEKIERAVAIGHDWGAGVVSKIAVYFPDRVLAFAFLAVGYHPPTPNFDIQSANKQSTEALGYANFGYWTFFAEKGADKIIESHLDSFYSLLFAADAPQAWAKHFCPEGAFKSWLLEDRKTELAPYIAIEAQKFKDNIMSNGGFAAPLQYYAARVQGQDVIDDKDVPLDHYIVQKPVFFGATLRDAACHPGFYKMLVGKLCPKATVVDFDTDHWVLFAEPDKVNAELQKWLDTLEL